MAQWRRTVAQEEARDIPPRDTVRDLILQMMEQAPDDWAWLDWGFRPDFAEGMADRFVLVVDERGW